MPLKLLGKNRVKCKFNTCVVNTVYLLRFHHQHPKVVSDLSQRISVCGHEFSFFYFLFCFLLYTYIELTVT